MKPYVGTIPADAKAKDVVAYIKEAVTAGAYDDSDLKGKVEGKVKTLETDMAAEKPKTAKNTSDIAALQGLVGEGYEAIPSEKIKALFAKVTE